MAENNLLSPQILLLF